MALVYFKGMTAYELQIGPVWVTWCHLTGDYWRWKPWRRFRAGLENSA
ncbi:hypothetical protein EVC29_031 [Rhizobium phage RHph_Y52]|nr:hypothetical protein EVB53_028 [Rhizobium phage RHph_Y60]QIG75260.1 hypothetical protein EVC16_031 [Rhizobium phage RHph_Y21]QIG76732.1 hypothetical protein EVC29_031 [Rhizobium phage RHph_Y52]